MSRPLEYDPSVMKEARKMAARNGWGARKIQKQLVEMFGEDKAPSGHSTVGDWIRGVESDPKLRPWGDGWPDGPEEIAYIFRLLDFTRRHPRLEGLLTQQVAKWALRLRVALEPSEKETDLARHLQFACDYAESELMVGVNEDLQFYTDILDSWVMYRFWLGGEYARRYEEDVKNEVVIGWFVHLGQDEGPALDDAFADLEWWPWPR